MSLGYFCISNLRIAGFTIEAVTVGIENGSTCYVKESLQDFKYLCPLLYDEFNIFQENGTPLRCLLKILTSEGTFFSAVHQFKSSDVGDGIILDLISKRITSKHKLVFSCIWIPLSNTLEYSRLSPSPEVI